MRKLEKRGVIGVVLVAVMVGALAAGDARADIGYGYAEQSVSALKVTGTTLTTSSVIGSITTASAAVNGTGIATNNPTDALQSYLLAPPPSSQNNFTKYSAFGGGPQAADFTRGDVLLTNSANLFTSGISISTVAETSATGSNGLETATSAWQISGTFTTSAASLTVSYSYFNDIIAQVSGTSESPANAQFGFLISIKDQHGHEIDSSPAEVNSSLAAPPNGPEIISSGTSSATLSLAGLTSGDLYSLSLSGQAQSAAAAPVPEPAFLATVAAAGLSLIRRQRSG